MSFTVASWNILADAYAYPERYPGIPAAILDPTWRHPALIRHVSGLGADVVCLQEVELDLFGLLEKQLRPRGYQGHYAQKTGRPDGCAAFIRTEALAVRDVRPLPYADGRGAGDSGHVALVLVLEQAGRLVVVANTHLKWDPPRTPATRQWGWRQLTQLLAERDALAPSEAAWIVCGDFNATANSAVVAVLRQAGWHDAYEGREHMRTCNSNRQARRIDYLWHTDPLHSRPVALRAITDHTALPSADEPSDHLAIMAWFDWAEPVADKLGQ
jgi:endonuclease/exonuclease/phosphatase family metal-dependent hydrolase